MQDLSSWIGRRETARDQIGATPVAALTATLDHPATEIPAGTPLPPLWHWLYFLPLHRQSEIGPDGHAQRGGFLPPVPLPRRMWAGSQFEFRSPVRVGDAVERTSTIADVTVKEGRSGQLVFVKVRHELRCNGAVEPAIVEFHDIVYRDAKKPGDVEPPPQKAPELDAREVSGSGLPGPETHPLGGQRPQGAWGRTVSGSGLPGPETHPLGEQRPQGAWGRTVSGSGLPGPETHPLGGQRPQGAWGRTLVPDDVLLFRYSALTFNGHRIHYDRRYVTEVEGYPGLVVHGPLIATLLLDLLRRQMPGADVAAFRFKAVRPTFDLHPFTVNGAPDSDAKTIKLWASDHEGWLTMDAVATLR